MKIRINRFQFLIGTVKTQTEKEMLQEVHEFQFLIGTVKTKENGLTVFGWKTGFNSS